MNETLVFPMQERSSVKKPLAFEKEVQEGFAKTDQATSMGNVTL
jgi:hypothetical protein